MSERLIKNFCRRQKQMTFVVIGALRVNTQVNFLILRPGCLYNYLSLIFQWDSVVLATVRVLAAWLSEETSAIRNEVYQLIPFIVEIRSV